ncbi:MAG TPA: alkaline phosphatase family protein [Candidatus Binatia bacterium]|nr:alkaline phosphatase family protein [Candidatus Binatia bacterium]
MESITDTRNIGGWTRIARASAPVAASLALAALMAGCGEGRRDEGPPPQKRVVVLGFDGVDPDFVQQWKAKLPNISKLMEEGSFHRLQTTTPPASCTAWSTFTTGRNPGGHGIFDFLLRDPKTYLPDRTGAVSHNAEYWFNLIPKKPETFTTTMSGEAFWTTADRAGKRSVVLRVPCIFPLEPMEHGYGQGGLGVPDIRGSEGTFHYWSSEMSPREAAAPELGGKVMSLASATEAETTIEGPANPLEEKHARLTVPLKIKSTGADSVTVTLDGRSESLKIGQWSDWFRMSFSVTPLSSISGMARFRLLEAQPNIKLYLSPINYDPADPAIAVTEPASYAKELHSAVGNFKTVGWNHETWGLNEERIDDEAFMQDVWDTYAETETITLRELDEKQSDLFISVFVETDRTAHMMYRLLDQSHPKYDAELAARFGDSIEKTYLRMDEIIGKVRTKLKPDDILMIISDHGFHSWKRGFNVNTWLVQEGYMALKGGAKSTERKFLQDVDWSKTRAYALGVGGIYLNVKGRDGKGIVAPGDEYDRLAREIADKLKTVTDPDTGQPVVAEVYLAKEVWKGERLADAQDLQVGLVSGYRVSSATPLGGAPEGLFENNEKKWSGDHATTQTSITEGILISNARIDAVAPSIGDLAPTILTLLGVEVPTGYDGKALSIAAPGGK